MEEPMEARVFGVEFRAINPICAPFKRNKIDHNNYRAKSQYGRCESIERASLTNFAFTCQVLLTFLSHRDSVWK
jgi:hypothetical protein